MHSKENKPIVVTLDAGGTNFVFGAMQGRENVVAPITLPSMAQDLDSCLGQMVKGFEQVIAQLPEKPVAISFAFPGPADYHAGIIGGYLPNFPSFREGVALGAILEDRFGMPVFINNDADLYALGEATAGMLPAINERLEQCGSTKRYRNLLGYTFGTGLGVGSVIDGRLNRGNNACVETFCLENSRQPGIIAEEGASIRAIVREYGDSELTPYDIFLIAEGKKEGDMAKAREAFDKFGVVAGDVIATAVTLTDSLVVIGGGLTGASRYFMPALLQAMRGSFKTLGGDSVGKVQMHVYDLDDEAEFADFARSHGTPLKVYGSSRFVEYDPVKRTGVAITRIGASQAISLGAYAFALEQLG